MQDEPGADDLLCNGKHPVDRGTLDDAGKRDCPFRSFAPGAPIRAILAPDEGLPARGHTVFVGAGTYPVFPFGLSVRGDGAGPDEAVVLTNYRGAEVTLDGHCPPTCTVETEGGAVTLDPCCGLPCQTCDQDPQCVPVQGAPGLGCVVPWDKVKILVTVWGQWVRVEGLTLRGCADDALRVAWAQTASSPPEPVPNDHLFLVNSSIEGCDLNENIKGVGSGPGPSQGGGAWGPVHVVGNELYAMASQGVDATGVHRWLVEENHLRDAKVGGIPGVIDYDGGGIGFKNGGSHARVRSNWLERAGSLGGGGTSGSCVEQTEPPAAWGCFQEYEMTDLLFENNVARDTGSRGLEAYQCDACRFFGNVVERYAEGAGLFVRDDCPGPRCPPHNPGLKPSRDLRLERNLLAAGPWTGEGPGLFAYFRDVHPDGPAGHGMLSRDNVYCAPDGVAESADPFTETALFAHDEPLGFHALSQFAPHIGDSGSAVYNDALARVAPCPSGPPRCTLSVDGAQMRWSGPADCPACSCALALDETEQPEPCEGARPLPAEALVPGRHYLALRVNRPGGGTSCGVSFHAAGAPVLGARCTIGVAGGEVSFHGAGVTCRLLADGATELGAACAGSLPLPPALLASGRHHLRLQVQDAPFGQTTCGVMYSP